MLDRRTGKGRRTRRAAPDPGGGPAREEERVRVAPESGAESEEGSAERPLRRSDYGDAFMPDPEEGPALAPDDLAESLAEDFVRSATTGTNAGDETAEGEIVPEEIGGPFVETTAAEEFADGEDESNPVDASAEPRPQAVRGLIQKPRG